MTVYDLNRINKLSKKIPHCSIWRSWRYEKIRTEVKEISRKQISPFFFWFCCWKVKVSFKVKVQNLGLKDHGGINQVKRRKFLSFMLTYLQTITSDTVKTREQGPVLDFFHEEICDTLSIIKYWLYLIFSSVYINPVTLNKVGYFWVLGKLFNLGWVLREAILNSVLWISYC